MPIQTAYTEVERLVDKFRHLSTAARKAYNEENTRKDFILPLFRALAWDTQNSVEVSAEEKVSRGWVDFSFRIGGVPRFFLETKRISEDLTKPQWVRQAMDYAWTKGVMRALLSDFEGLRVFNADWKEDNPLRAQFIDFGVDSYLADFERLWWLSRPAVRASCRSATWRASTPGLMSSTAGSSWVWKGRSRGPRLAHCGQHRKSAASARG